MSDKMKNNNKLVQVISKEKENIRGLINNNNCNNKYTDFLAGKIQTLDWVIMQLDKIKLESLGLDVVFTCIDNKDVDLRER